MCVLVCVCMCVCASVCTFYTLLYNDFCCCPSSGRAQLASDAGVCCTYSPRRFVITAIRVEPQSIPLSLPLSLSLWPCGTCYSGLSACRTIDFQCCIHYLIAPSSERLDRLFPDVICMQTILIPISHSQFRIRIRFFTF